MAEGRVYWQINNSPLPLMIKYKEKKQNPECHIWEIPNHGVRRNGCRRNGGRRNGVFNDFLYNIGIHKTMNDSMLDEIMDEKKPNYNLS